jgi:hypothetical protein
MEDEKMKSDSIFKKMLLLTLGSIVTLQLQVVNAAEDSDQTNSSNEVEECVIMDDQRK